MQIGDRVLVKEGTGFVYNVIDDPGDVVYHGTVVIELDSGEFVLFNNYGISSVDRIWVLDATES